MSQSGTFAFVALSILTILSAFTADTNPAKGGVQILADRISLPFWLMIWGFGDLQCTNPDAQTKTPNLNRLSREGLRFTDVAVLRQRTVPLPDFV